MFARARKTVRGLSPLDGGIVAIASLVAAGLSVGNMTRWSIWFDEAFSAMIVKHSFLDIARYTASDVHPPLYYWTLKVWTMLWGGSPLALRSLSLVWLLIAIVVVFIAVHRQFGRIAAALTTLMLAVSPMMIRYSDEARMYTMVLAITAIATVLLIRATRHPRLCTWITYGVLVAFGMLTHYLTAVVWIIHWLWRYTEMQRQHKRQWYRHYISKGWLVAYGVALIVITPWLPSMYQQLTSIQSGGFWIGAVRLDTLVNYITNLYAYYDHGQVVGWMTILFLVALATAGWVTSQLYQTFNPQQRSTYRLVLLLAWGAPMLLYMLSLPPLRSSFVDRYLLSVMGFWVCWLGITYGRALAYRSMRVVAVLGIIVTLALNVIGLTYVYQVGNLNKDNGSIHTVGPMMDLVSDNTTPGEPIIAATSWLFYEATYYDTARTPTYFRSEDDTSNGAYAMLRDNTAQKITDMSQFGSEHPQVWFIVSQPSTTEPSRVPAGWKIVRTLYLPNSPSTLRAVEMRYIVN